MVSTVTMVMVVFEGGGGEMMILMVACSGVVEMVDVVGGQKLDKNCGNEVMRWWCDGDDEGGEMKVAAW
ncbi:hypothetical protein Tco_0056328 [Tanacetum coccineum]